MTSSLSDAQKRVLKVLDNLAQMARASEESAEMLQDGLEDMLEVLASSDAFGTEGQNDPRGDFRDGNWSMWHIQGIDD